MESTNVVAVFGNQREAESAVHALIQNHFPPETIRLVVRDDKSKAFYDQERSSNVSAGVGAGIGALGGLFVGITMFILPLALVAAGVGAAVGATIGGFLGLNMSQDEELRMQQALQRGGTIVSVRSPVDKIARVVSILDHHGATSVDQREITPEEEGAQVAGPVTASEQAKTEPVAFREPQ